MGYPTQQQKVDYLFKKIGFTKTKTGVAEDQTSGFSGDTKKAPPNEAIASPLIIPGSSVWSDSGFITATPPTSNTAYVGVYTTATAYRMTVDTTVANERTFIARQTWGNPSSAIEGDWIDTQFGADYLIKVYKNDPSVGVAGVDYFNLSAAGTTGKDDVWFFDYSSGVLNFNGEDLDGQLSGITTSNIYIVGYRYIGRKGIQPPAGIGTFHDLVVSNNLSVGGISTFGGLIDANGIIEGIAGQNKIPSLYANYSDLPNAGTYHGMFAHVHGTQKGYFAHAGGWYELVNKETNGRVGTGTETYHINNLNVTGITTLGNIGISTGRITGPAVTYIDPATVGDDTGTLVVKGNLQVEGTQTTVNSSTMTVTDKNIELAKGAANDAAADGGGITIDSGGGDKTWQWLDATDSWTSSEHIRIPDGKVFSFTPDTNTYIGRPAADTIAFTHGSIERLRITSEGNLEQTLSTEAQGFKQTNANNHYIYNIIDANRSAANDHILIQQGRWNGKNVAAMKFRVGTDTTNKDDGYITFETSTANNQGEKVRITSDGKVGIGTTTPSQKLDVRGNGVFLNSGNDTSVSIGGTVGNNNAFFDLVGDATYTDYGLRLFRNDGGANTTSELKHRGTGALKLVVEDAGSIQFFTSGTASSNERFRITSAGNVGINSSVPAAKLDVNGTSQFQDDITIQSANGNNIVFDKSDNALKFGNDVELRFGLFQQFRIRQNGTTGSSEIIHNRTESLVLHSDKLDLRPYTNGSNVYLRANYNDSVDLYFANSKKFETTNAGVNITGITTTTQLEIGTLGQSLVGITTILDEDNFASNSATALATQQSIKAYVDTTVTAQDLDIAGDSGTGAVDLDSQSLTIAGTSNEIETSASNQTVTIGLPNDVSITNLTLGGTVSAGSTTGTNGYYLKTTGIGVTWAAFPSSRTTSTQTATAGQTTFNFSYNVGYVDVFLNGVKLPGSEFTASNGSTIVLDDAAFVNDTLEFVSYNTVPNSSAGAQNLTGLADVTITGTPVIGETLQHNGSVFVNDYTVSATTTSTSQTAISSLPIATYRSVEYTIQVTEGTKYHVTKVLAIHDGTNVSFNEYGTLTTSTSLSTFALDINSGNMRLLATPASTNSTVFKVKFTGIKV